MKKTADITREIVKSIFIPLHKHIHSNSVSINELIDGIGDHELQELELYKFIDFVKKHTLAMKISYRCNRKVFYELVGRFLEQLETIGDFGDRYNKKLDDIACGEKCNNSLSNSLEDEIERILVLARQAKKEIEKDYEERRIAVKERKKSKEVMKT